MPTKNPEKLRAKYRRKYLSLRRRRPEVLRARTRRGRAAERRKKTDKFKERMKVSNHARRARKAGNGGKPSPGIQSRLMRLQDGKCIYCRQRIVKPYIDHILPLALGGSSDDHNLQILCRSCNGKKGASHPIAFANKLGMLL